MDHHGKSHFSLFAARTQILSVRVFINLCEQSIFYQSGSLATDTTNPMQKQHEMLKKDLELYYNAIYSIVRDI